MDELRVPDVAGEIVGWRAWRVWPVNGRGDTRLGSIFDHWIWPKQGWLTAQCARQVRHGDVPGEWCTCGVYAARDRAHLLAQGYHEAGDEEIPNVVAIGQVALAGKVIVCTRGWRAALARPLRLWLPYDAWRFANGLREGYRIHVGLSDTYDVEGEVANGPR